MNRRLGLYLIVCFGFSWTVAAGVWLMGGLQVKNAALLLFPSYAGILGLVVLQPYWLSHFGCILELRVTEL